MKAPDSIKIIVQKCRLCGHSYPKMKDKFCEQCFVDLDKLWKENKTEYSFEEWIDSLIVAAKLGETTLRNLVESSIGKLSADTFVIFEFVDIEYKPNISIDKIEMTISISGGDSDQD